MSKLYDLLYAMIGKLNSSVKTTAQTLTDAEKTQARANIGAQVTGDYAEKKDIPTVPTKVSAFTNDAGYLTQHQDLSAYAKKTEIPSKLPNPHALTINGKTYDGTSAVSIKVEGGSGGAQADWKAARGLPGHVLHRTHWVDEAGTALLDETVYFDIGMAYIEGLQLVDGASYTVTFNGLTDTCVAAVDGVGDVWIRPSSEYGSMADFMYTPPNEEDGIEEVFAIYPGEGEGIDEAQIKLVVNDEIVHKLPAEFLPDNIGGGADWNAAEGEPGHILNKPFGDIVVAILPEADYAFAPVELLDGMVGAMVEVTNIMTVGNTYKVMYNGVEYVCESVDIDGMSAIGDYGAFIGGESTGEPFLIISTDALGYPVVIVTPMTDADGAKVGVSGVTSVPIPGEYAPNPVFLDLVALGLPEVGETEVSVEFNDAAIIRNAAKRGIIMVNLRYSVNCENPFGDHISYSTGESGMHLPMTIVESGNGYYMYTVSAGALITLHLRDVDGVQKICGISRSLSFAQMNG